MEKAEFYNLVENHIVPLFTGSYLAGEIESSARDSEVAFGKGNSILLKPTKSDDYRVVLKRGLAFKTFEVEIIRSIIHEFSEISAFGISDKMYLTDLHNVAIEKAMIDSIAENGTQTILGVISYLDVWASRTYEGANVDLGILINLGVNLDGQAQVNYNDFISKDFFALITDGINSFVEFDRNGVFLGYVSLKNSKNVQTISPHVYEKVARICNDKRVGIVLTKKGDILVFYARQLIFAKRSGHWCVYSHEEIIRLLSSNVSYTAKQIRRSIYNTALDCSFSYKGACLAYINKDKTLAALSHIDASDIISEEHFEMKKNLELEEAQKLYNLSNAKKIVEKFSLSYQDFLVTNKYTKTMAIRKMIAGRKLFELDRKLIEELTSIDGATIVDYDGTIIAVGAIIKIEAGSAGGGRLAATTTMAKYGVAIKVSQDGIMQGFTVDKKGNSKKIFNVGGR